jgi:hypothetical protein
VSDETVSLQTAREHHRVWRWRLEVEPAQRFENAWVEIAASSLPDDAKIRLADVAWAASAFERAYHVLLDDIVRAEAAKRDGVPPILELLSGRYNDSLERLLYTSLWMDLGDVFVAYRTIAKRVQCCKRHPFSDAEIKQEIDVFEGRRLPELSATRMTRLAGRILHTTWDPRDRRELAIQIYWKGPNGETLDFAEGDFRGSLSALVDETLDQTDSFISKALTQASSK